MSRVDSPRAYISTARASSSSVRPRTISRIRERNGSARSAICGTLYSMAPSALFTSARSIAVAIAAPGTAPRA